MGVAYDGLGSELISESERGIWKAGRRCPDIYLSQAGNDTKRLYSILSYGKFLVIAVGARQGCHRYFTDLCTHLTLLPAVSTREEANGDSDKTPAEENIFSSDIVAQDDAFVVIVRPDMYIGYVGVGEEEWRKYLADVFTH